MMLPLSEFLLHFDILLIYPYVFQLDGWIARNYPSQRSALGSVIDPLADKLLVSILYITLTMVHLIPGR